MFSKSSTNRLGSKIPVRRAEKENTDRNKQLEKENTDRNKQFEKKKISGLPVRVTRKPQFEDPLTKQDKQKRGLAAGPIRVPKKEELVPKTPSRPMTPSRSKKLLTTPLTTSKSMARKVGSIMMGTLEDSPTFYTPRKQRNPLPNPFDTLWTEKESVSETLVLTELKALLDEEAQLQKEMQELLH